MGSSLPLLPSSSPGVNPQIGKPGTAFEFPRTENSCIQATFWARNFAGCPRFASGYNNTTVC